MLAPVRTRATSTPGPTAPSGAFSSALLASASVVATGLNYLFLVAAGRLLGNEDYGELAALLGLLTVVLLPTGAVQLAVSREVSRRLALGEADEAHAFTWATLRLGLVVTVPLAVVAFAFVVPIRELLNIDSTAAVTLAAAGVVVALILPITIGVLQGYQRFPATAALYVLPFALRLVLLAAVAVWAENQVGGAMFAAVGGALLSACVALWLVRAPMRLGARMPRPDLRPFLHYLWPVVVGLIGIALLTNGDILVVKARFSADDAGDYAAASAFARVAFFLPATVLAVLFPRTAARQARGEDTADILGRSLIVTAAFCALLAGAFALVGDTLVRLSFGAEFADAGEILPELAVAMMFFSLANVLVGFHLSRGETRYAWIVAVAVVVQMVLLATIPSSLEQVVWADILVGIALLAAHELLVGSSVPALRAGLRRMRG
jgi:O-antigen/teichoic acid export membrane protein